MDDDYNYYLELIDELDEGPWEVTKWEADFLASVIEQGGYLSRRQKEILDDMAKKYGVEL